MKKYSINLLKKSDEDITKKIVYFALYYLRYIVVITATISLGVFFYGILVNTEIVELKEQVNQKEEIIKVTKPIVLKTEEVSEKIANVNSIIKEQEKKQGNINGVLESIPENIILDNFRMENGRLKVSGLSYDYNTVKIFSNRLKKTGLYKVVNIDSLNKDNLGFKFVISLQP